MANSIKTNFAAMTALQSLNITNSALEKTQNRISTGFKVNEAADNAAYWAISATLRSDNAALSTVQDSLGLGAGLVDVAYTGLNEAKKIVDQIRQKLVGAKEKSLDRGLVALDVQALREALLDIATGASYSGQNRLVASATATASIVSSYTRSTAGVATIGTIDLSVGGSVALFAAAAGTGGLLGTLAGNLTAANFNSATADNTLDTYITNATNALTALVRAATTVGSIKAQISSTQDYVKSLRDALDRGISALVDADMNEESTRLQALQTQQQLGVQALSIANQSSQSIMRLFQ
jgi:flagellin